MLSVHLEEGRVSVVKRPRPRRPRGHALLRLITAGVCNTDLELQRGYYGFRGTPGHEFVAWVEECDNPDLLGRRVVGEINLACGSCEWCGRGLARHCPHRTTLGIMRHAGAFAEFLTLPEENLFVVPAKVSNEQAVFAEPIAAACEILEQVRIPKGAPVAVLGDGKLGVLIAQVLQLHGASVHHFGRHKEKLAISAAAGVVAMPVRARPPAAAYDYVVEATGSAEGFAQAAAMTRPRGTLVLKSTVHGAVPVDMAPLIVNEITMVGSRCGRFAPALKLLASGRLHLDEMITARYPLAEAAEAFARAAQKGVVKVLLDA
jgi:alcohol dehydrogenase